MWEPKDTASYITSGGIASSTFLLDVHFLLIFLMFIIGSTSVMLMHTILRKRK